MPVSDWLDLMPNTLTYEAAATFDAYGKPATYATAVSYRCRVVYRNKRVSSRVTGQDQVSPCRAWVAGVLTTLSVSDRITLPDSSTPPIVSWDILTDNVGTHHTVVYFGA